MMCEHIAVVLISQFLALVGLATGEKCYGAQFSEDVWGCPDFDNKMLQCDSLHLGSVEGQEDQLGLNGNVTVGMDIEDGTKVNVEIWKVLDIGKEFMYHVNGDLCESLKDEQSVWYPLVQSMKITECPIAANDYPIKDMTISLEHAKGMLNHALCGEYLMDISTYKEAESDKESCFQFGITVNEFDC